MKAYLLKERFYNCAPRGDKYINAYSVHASQADAYQEAMSDKGNSTEFADYNIVQVENKISFEDVMQDFIEQYHPNYNCDEILLVDILSRYLDNEELSDDDLAYIHDNFKNVVEVSNELTRLEMKVFQEAYENYIHENIRFHGQRA